jgi:acetylornithine/succinyldiaminopimelate/putrescine aminotransferase
MGLYLRKHLEKLRDAYPDLIVDIRGRGLMQGMELSEDPSKRFINMIREEGVLFCSAGHNTIRFVPPLIIQLEEIDECADAMSRVFAEMAVGSE